MPRHTTIRFLTIVLLTVLLVLQRPSYSISADSTLSVASVFIAQGSGIQPDSTRRDVETLFGKPLRVEHKYIKNTHHPYFVDRIHTYHYDGMAIQFYEATLADKEFVVTVAVNSNHHQPVSPVHIGSTQNEVVELLGAPTMIYGNLLIYDEMHAGLGRVCLRMKEGVVQAILWQFYFD